MAFINSYEWGTMAYLPNRHVRPLGTSAKLTCCRLVKVEEKSPKKDKLVVHVSACFPSKALIDYCCDGI